MSNSSTSAAATSSCVERGFDAQRTTSAPASGCSRSKRSRIAASTGICRSAQAIRRTPSGASARSFTSCRCVVAIQSFRLEFVPLRGEQPLVLALLPVQRRELGPGEPALDGASQLRLAAEPRRERDVRQLDIEPAPQLAERAQLIELEQPIAAVAAGGSAR